MTLIVGIRCTDGVVVAADQAVTFGVARGHHTISHRACKIRVLEGQVIVAGTGQIGMGQRFAENVETFWKSGKGKSASHLDIVRQVTALAVQDFAGTNAAQGAFGALMAFPKNHTAHLCEFAVADLQPEMKDAKTWFVAMGSGQVIADPYLALFKNIYWGEGPPTVRRGLFAAAWVMRHSIKVAPGLVAEPIDIAVLQGSKARMLDGDELQVHLESVDAAVAHFRTFDPETPPTEEAPSIPELKTTSG